MSLVLLEPVRRAHFKCVCIMRVGSIYDMNKQISPIRDVIGTVRTSKSCRFQMCIESTSSGSEVVDMHKQIPLIYDAALFYVRGRIWL